MEELNGVASITPQGGFNVVDADRFTGRLMDQIVWTAVFAEDAAVRDAARWIIRAGSLALGAVTSSIQTLYDAISRGETGGFTVPAHNIRIVTYEMARALFRAAKETDAAFFVFEIAKSEMGYTDQRPAEYSACVLAAALREGWKGPVFIQGDHFQFNAKKYAEDPEAETEGIRALALEAMEAGFFNIDIDSSTLVDLSREGLDAQQKDNYSRCAELTAHIRKNQPPGVTISVGGEIGEVGKKNSTVEEFEAYMAGYRRDLDALLPKVKGISKISVQTGTSHGGVPLPDGSVAEASIDFDVLRNITAAGRKNHGISGTVQHGASTLPEDQFSKFPESDCVEVHLATQFQNLFYEHPSFPVELREEMYAWIRENLKGEFKDSMTDEQNIYKTRKKAFGTFKHKIWMMPDDNLNPILASLERKFVSLLRKLNMVNTRTLVAEYIRPVPICPPIPEALAQALAPTTG